MPYTYTYGSGAENDPYQVWDADDLNGLIDYDGAVGIGVYFKQMDNIDMEGITYNLPGISSDWQANYDGNNKYIYSLNKPFMGYTWESTISDLILIGDIVDYTDLFAFGGFICGPYGGSHIKRCGFIGDIKWPSRGAGEWAIEVIGGFASEMSWGGGTIERCFAVGTLDFGLQNIGNTYGGFISYATDGGGGQPNISNCFARFNIVGSGNVYDGDGENVGGFIGFTNNVVNITHCYTASSINISEKNNQGCFVGDIRGTGLNITNCYYDSDLCSLGDDSDAESRTTNQMIYPYSEPENVYINWAFYGEDSDPVWQHDKEGLKYDVTQTLNDPVFIIDTCLVHGPDRSFVEYRYLAYLLHQKTYWDGAALIFAGYDLTAHINEIDYDDLIYLPVRYIAQDLLGLIVTWDEPNWQVHIEGKVTGPINDGYPHFIRGLTLKYKYMKALPGGTINYL